MHFKEPYMTRPADGAIEAGEEEVRWHGNAGEGATRWWWQRRGRRGNVAAVAVAVTGRGGGGGAACWIVRMRLRRHRRL
uniref:Uncharacterized protein n=1 Tax=Oryza glumipatula TaxID=40148 RepID=A0A0D9Z9V6_9ORYZ